MKYTISILQERLTKLEQMRVDGQIPKSSADSAIKELKAAIKRLKE